MALGQDFYDNQRITEMAMEQDLSRCMGKKRFQKFLDKWAPKGVPELIICFAQNASNSTAKLLSIHFQFQSVPWHREPLLRSSPLYHATLHCKVLPFLLFPVINLWVQSATVFAAFIFGSNRTCLSSCYPNHRVATLAEGLRTAHFDFTVTP
eukprot:1156503-Pelagomonas_calceolata.AAC.6